MMHTTGKRHLQRSKRRLIWAEPIMDLRFPPAQPATSGYLPFWVCVFLTFPPSDSTISKRSITVSTTEVSSSYSYPGLSAVHSLRREHRRDENDSLSATAVSHDLNMHDTTTLTRSLAKLTNPASHTVTNQIVLR